jgi:hypothetical protein
MGKIFSYSPRRAQAELKRQQRFAQVKADQAIWEELVAEDIAKRTAAPKPAGQAKRRR